MAIKLLLSNAAILHQITCMTQQSGSLIQFEGHLHTLPG